MTTRISTKVPSELNLLIAVDSTSGADGVGILMTVPFGSPVELAKISGSIFIVIGCVIINAINTIGTMRILYVFISS